MSTYQKQLKDIQRSQKLVGILIDLLEKMMLDKDALGSMLDEPIWGGKETMLSALTKLTNLQSKLMPLEEKILGQVQKEGKKEQGIMDYTPIELELLENYINKLKQRNTQTTNCDKQAADGMKEK